MKKIVGLDWHSATNNQAGKLFWSDIEKNMIFRSDLDGRNGKVKISNQHKFLKFKPNKLQFLEKKNWKVIKKIVFVYRIRKKFIFKTAKCLFFMSHFIFILLIFKVLLFLITFNKQILCLYRTFKFDT